MSDRAVDMEMLVEILKPIIADKESMDFIISYAKAKYLLDHTEFNRPVLKSCPFCGSINPQWHGQYIVCDKCGCRTEEENVLAKAILKWNARV